MKKAKLTAQWGTCFFLSTLFLCCNSPLEQTNSEAHLTPADHRKIEHAVQGLEVHPDLAVQLFAAEPMLINPTNMDVDERGRVWVTEAFNYRSSLNPGNPINPKGDRIVILEDTNGDGQADESKVFYQGNDINSALGITVLGKNVIVSCSPNVWIFTDEDGDDIPEKKELLFTGIGGEQHDHAMHAFTFGPDGKLYFNFGNAGTQIHDKNNKPITDVAGNLVNNQGAPYRQGMIFRCNPDGSEFEVLAHNFRNNYEVAVDSYGRLWQSDNDDDGNRAVRINYILKYGNYGFTDQVTGAGWRSKRTGMHAEIPKRHWHLNDPGTVPNLLQTGAGSPTGILVYEGRLLPEVFWDQMIHTDAGPNVVRAYPVTKKDAGFTADMINVLKGVDDAWFRPSDLTTAPDGSLFVADWYDPGVGGHQMGDQQQGRIYRIAPENTPYKTEAPTLSTLNDAVLHLQSPNLTTRYLAYQKLQNGGAESEQALQSLLNHENPRMEARALWLLSKISADPTKYVDQAIGSSNEDLRICGLNMALQLEGFNLIELLQELVEDPSAQVRRETAIALRFLDTPAAADLWAALAMQYEVGDRWYLEALGIGADLHADLFFKTWLTKIENNWNTPAGRDLVWRSRSPLAMPMLGQLIKDPSTTATEKLRYFRALDFHQPKLAQTMLMDIANAEVSTDPKVQRILLNQLSNKTVKNNKTLMAILNTNMAQISDTTQYLDWVQKFNITDRFDQLESIFLNAPNTANGRQAAQVLYRKKGLTYFEELLNNNDPTIVYATIEALGDIRSTESWELKKKLAFDESNDLNLRRQAIKVLGTGWGEEDRLLKLLMDGEVPPELTEAAVSTLLQAIKSSIRQQALAILSKNNKTELKPVSELVALSGHSDAGALVFNKLCKTCHQVNGDGIAFGPDLSEIGSKLAIEGLFTAIIYPNAGINFGYEGYVVTLKDDTKEIGYMVSNTEASIELRKAGGITSTILRTDIKSIEALENSLMMEGLAAVMTETELVDLVEYLSSLKRLDI